MKMFKYIVENSDINKRIDVFLEEKLLDYTRSRIQKLIKDKCVRCNNGYLLKSYKVNANDEIVVEIPEIKPTKILEQNIPLDIIYEDNDVLVVNKPKCMVVHPAPGNYENTLVNALMYYCKGSLSGINGELRPGIVHRIDKDTSGLLMIAKNDNAHNFLSQKLSTHDIIRQYHAVVYGNIKDDEGTINAPIGRHNIDRKKMCINEKNGKKAITHFTVLERFSGFTYI